LLFGDWPMACAAGKRAALWCMRYWLNPQTTPPLHICRHIVRQPTPIQARWRCELSGALRQARPPRPSATVARSGRTCARPRRVSHVTTCVTRYAPQHMCHISEKRIGLGVGSRVSQVVAKHHASPAPHAPDHHCTHAPRLHPVTKPARSEGERRERPTRFGPHVEVPNMVHHTASGPGVWRNVHGTRIAARSPPAHGTGHASIIDLGCMGSYHLHSSPAAAM
jgi:hypothetical protein